jgi:uncharacterized protein DUF6471
MKRLGSQNRIRLEEAEWAERASNFLKTKFKEKEVTYVDLVKRLKKHGFTETEASITNKLKRGTPCSSWRVLRRWDWSAWPSMRYKLRLRMPLW